MLVLSRKVGEVIVIGDGITVTVQRMAGGRVSLAVEAPREVRILRGELNAFDGHAVAGLGSAELDDRLVAHHTR